MTSQESTESKAPVVCVFCASQPGRNPAHLASARALAQELHSSGTLLVYGAGTEGIMGELAKTLVSLSGPDAVHGIIPRALVMKEKGYDGAPIAEREKSHSSSNNNSPAPPRPPTGSAEGAAATGMAEAGGKAAEKTLSANEQQHIDSSLGTSTLLPASEFGITTVVPDMHTRKRLMASKVIAGGPGSGFVALAGGYGTIEEVMEMVTWNQLGIHKMPIVLVNVDGYWDGLLEWVRNSVREGYVSEGNSGILVEVKDVKDVVPALLAYRVSPGRYALDWS